MVYGLPYIPIGGIGVGIPPINDIVNPPFVPPGGTGGSGGGGGASVGSGNALVDEVLNRILNIFLVPIEGISYGVGNLAFTGLDSVSNLISDAVYNVGQSPMSAYLGMGIGVLTLVAIGLLLWKMSSGL